MSIASAIHASAAVLLVVAGVAKLARPADGFSGLVGFRPRPLLVRILGGVEIVAGAGALWLGGPVAAAAVGLLYTVFALAVVRALLARTESCGCFGRLDAPPSWIHVGGNLALAAVSFVAAAAGRAPVPTIVQQIGDSPAVGMALAAEIVVMAGLILVAFTALPEALGVRTSRRGADALFRAVPAPAARPATVTAPQAGPMAVPGSGSRPARAAAVTGSGSRPAGPATVTGSGGRR